MIFCSSPMKHKLSKMDYLVSCVAFTLLFLAHIIPSEAADQDSPNHVKAKYSHGTYKIFDIKAPLVLSCDVVFAQPRPYVLEWLKEDKPISEVASMRNRYKLIPDENSLVIDRSIESDGGNYTCRLANSTSVEMYANITAVAKPVVKLPPNTSVVEGEKMRLVCTVLGSPTPSVVWSYNNETYKESGGRVTLSPDNGVENAVLTVAEASLDDRGSYTCTATNIATNYVNVTNDATFVRVKDKLAALWPFLGICAEVFVLCTIILVYEKRRNKPEMEESDTDQSPDQKKG